eukprot:3703166-Rhodomonas_salina.4
MTDDSAVCLDIEGLEYVRRRNGLEYVRRGVEGNNMCIPTLSSSCFLARCLSRRAHVTRSRDED